MKIFLGFLFIFNLWANDYCHQPPEGFLVEDHWNVPQLSEFELNELRFILTYRTFENYNDDLFEDADWNCEPDRAKVLNFSTTDLDGINRLFRLEMECLTAAPMGFYPNGDSLFGTKNIVFDGEYKATVMTESRRGRRMGHAPRMDLNSQCIVRNISSEITSVEGERRL